MTSKYVTMPIGGLAGLAAFLLSTSDEPSAKRQADDIFFKDGNPSISKVVSAEDGSTGGIGKYLSFGGKAYGGNDNVSPPKELVEETIKLYQEVGDLMNVNQLENAKKYISTFQPNLKKLLNYDLSTLDNNIKNILSDAFNNYGLSIIKYNEKSGEKNVNEFDKGKEMYFVSLNLKPNDISVLRNLGIYYLVTEKNYEKALSTYEKILEIDPDNKIGQLGKSKSLKNLEL